MTNTVSTTIDTSRTATVHLLPTATKPDHLRSIDEQAQALQPGQWVRVTYKDDDGTTGVIEGTVRKPSHLTNTLFVGHRFCLHARGYADITITSIETEKRPALNFDDLADRIHDWATASVAFEEKPVGRFQTGDNIAEAEALLEAETAVRDYLNGVRI